MEERELTLTGEEQTLALGAALAAPLKERAGALPRALCVYRQGDRGAGKTTFTRGLLRALGFEGAVRSPTYTLVESYAFDGFEIFHFDLYRLQDPEELEYMGIRDYFAKSALCLIEWPDRAGGRLPEPDLTLELCCGRGFRRAVLRSALSQLVSPEFLKAPV